MQQTFQGSTLKCQIPNSSLKYESKYVFLLEQHPAQIHVLHYNADTSFAVKLYLKFLPKLFLILEEG